MNERAGGIHEHKEKHRNIFFHSSGNQNLEIKVVSRARLHLAMLGESSFPLPTSVAVGTP